MSILIVENEYFKFLGCIFGFTKEHIKVLASVFGPESAPGNISALHVNVNIETFRRNGARGCAAVAQGWFGEEHFVIRSAWGRARARVIHGK